MGITNGYNTIDEFVAYTGINTAQKSSYTTKIEQAIENISRDIDALTGRIFYEKTVSEIKIRYNTVNENKISISYSRNKIIFPANIVSISKFQIDGEDVDTEDYAIVGDSIIYNGYLPIDPFEPITISGTYGETYPPDIRNICTQAAAVLTGLSSYTFDDGSGQEVTVTRQNIPTFLQNRLKGYMRCHFR